MSKKVLILSASPRKSGNSDLLCNEFLKGTQEAGNKAALQRTLEEFRGFTYCLNNPKEKGIVYGTGAWQMGDIKGKPAMSESYNLGKNV